MSNSSFLRTFFPDDFWPRIKERQYPVDEQNMFADAPVFEWLINTFRPNSIVEVGSWKGHSANFMADVAKAAGLTVKIICVDTFLGSSEHWHIPELRKALHIEGGRPTVLERFLGNTISRKNDDAIFPLSTDSIAASHLLRVNDFEADLIFIDAAHDPESVTRDLVNYYSLLSPRGIMFGDDYQHEPLATALHIFAASHASKVLVWSRKWVLINDTLLSNFFPESTALRASWAGWVHP